jgi:predicted metal-dependent peptidase
MNKSTSNDIAIVSNATSEQIENFKLSKHLLKLLMEEPFYSRIIRSLNKVETTSIPTAGVLCHDGDLTLWWNRSFLAGLSPKENTGLLKHECLHLVFEHTTERKKEPHLIWNYATDLGINSIIPYEELPKGGLIPGRRLPDLSKEELEKMSDDSIESYNHISELIYSLPPNKTSEYYFERLIKDEKIQQKADSFKGLKLGFDDHEGWGDLLDDAEKEFLKAKLKEILGEAIKEADVKGWGTISNVHRKEFYKLIERKVIWEDILKRFCGFTRRDERRSSNKRLNRKYPGIHPGIKKLYKPMIAVYIDESGSMNDDSLNKFYNELNVLSKFTDFYVYRFDAEVQEKDGFLWKKGKSIKLKRGMCGGTCFKSVTKHAFKNKKLFDGYIIFTDGCAPKPPISRGIKRCWLLSPNCSLNFAKDKKDILINMK